MKKIIIFLLLSLIFSNDDQRTFHLKSGDKITGKVLNETEISYDIETSFGKVTIFKDEIKDDKITITLKSGDKITGTLLDESNANYKVKTTFGELTIAKDSVEYIDFLNSVNINSNNPISKKDDNRFYYGDEQLIDIWFDPVGFTLAENTLYFSGVSWAYGISNKLQISSAWLNYLWGDLNFRPKYMIYKGGDVDKTNALSLGFDFHMRGLPSKFEFVNRDDDDYGNFNISPCDDENDEDCDRRRWERIGEGDGDEGDQLWGQVFIAFTQSNLKKSGQGRINYNFGLSVTFLEDYKSMPRFYSAIDVDARKNLKLMAEISYDEYYAPWYNRINDEESMPVHFDFGFMYTYSDNLRFGIHYQVPFIAFYYKF